MIALNKYIHKWCVQNGIDFDIAYTEFNKTYNDGYEKLGKLNVVRPYLKHMDGKIGGHCVMPNLDFLVDSEITNLIKWGNNGCN